MSTSTFSLLRPPDDSSQPLFGTEAFGADTPVNSGSLIFGTSDNIFSSLFDPLQQPVDPTNSGDTGANQNISTPPLAGKNNPETGGGTDLGTVLNNAVNAAFAGWQLATLPKTTPKTVQTQVGTTRVVAGTPSLASSIFGPTAAGTSQGSQLLVIGILIIVGILIYKSVKK